MPGKLILEGRKNRLETLWQREQAAMQQRLNAAQRTLALAKRSLDALNPMSVLRRGFAVVEKADGALVTEAKSLREGEGIAVLLHDGPLARARGRGGGKTGRNAGGLRPIDGVCIMEEWTFEQGMAELEATVRALEGGQLALNDSFEAYKRGAELYQKLKAMLDEGEARITMLTKEGESEIARPEQ